MRPEQIDDAVDHAIEMQRRIEALEKHIKEAAADHDRMQQSANNRIEQLESALRDAPKPSKSASHPGWYGLPEREEYVYWYVNPRSKALASEADKGDE